MATVNKSRRTTGSVADTKPIRLSSHDINVVSVIAQKTKLPHRILIEYAKKSNVSSDALRVIYVLLESPAKGNSSAKTKDGKVLVKNVATDFSKWAAKLK